MIPSATESFYVHYSTSNNTVHLYTTCFITLPDKVAVEDLFQPVGFFASHQYSPWSSRLTDPKDNME